MGGEGVPKRTRRPYNGLMPTLLEELRSLIEAEMDQMTSVATGGPSIKYVDGEYRERRKRIRSLLGDLGLEDPNPHVDLWAWYGKWSRDLKTYQARRDHIREMFNPLLKSIEDLQTQPLGSGLPEAETTGWDAVDGQVAQLRIRLAKSETSEDFQAIGLLCRDILISLGEAAHDPAEHGEVGESGVDRLNAVVDAYSPGESNQKLRKLLKATFDYANVVQHQRTGAMHEAGICAEATVAATQIIRRLVSVPEQVD